MTDGVDWVFVGNHIRISFLAGARDDIIATFDHRREGRTGFDAVSETSWFHAQGFGHLRIQTAANDWYLNADLAAAQAAAKAYVNGRFLVRMLGFSMGGFGALQFGAALGAHSGLLISPSLPRPFADPAALRAAAMGPDYTAVIDPTIPVDVWRADLLQDILPSLRIMRLQGGGHPATQQIQRAGRFNDVRKVASGLAGSPRLLRHAHGMGMLSAAG